MNETHRASPHPARTTGNAGRRPRPGPAPASERGVRAELRDAITGRTVLLVLGVLVLQFGFILSYVGAFHAPKPHRIPLVVAAPARVADHLSAQLNGLDSRPLDAAVVGSPDAARRAVTRGKAGAALLVNPSGDTDTLLVASGGGTSVASAAQSVLEAVERAQGRSLTVRDIVPLQPGDGRGLTGFYLVVGWMVGGYLMAALLGVAKGARPANPRRAVIRLASVVPYALVSGLGGALVVDQVLGALTGHFLALWGLGALLVLAAATVTMAFEVLFGVLGVGLAVLVFVVLGNPSAGGAYQPSLLPPFWRALSQSLPNGAGTDAVRQIVYFGGSDIGLDVAVITIYAVAGVLVTVAASVLRARRPRQPAAAPG